MSPTQLLPILILINCFLTPNGHRMKRHVVFTKSSKFFIRLNGKDNIFTWTDLFAHGWTIRGNYDLPSDIPGRRNFFKRDLVEQLKTRAANEWMMVMHSCLLKYLCEKVDTLRSDDSCGIFCKIGNIVKRSKSREAEFFNNLLDDCPYHCDNCPFSIQNSY